eukprot:COSAG05_NODE_1758_length_4138_cov_1092.842783_2_plen_616_part_00
MGFSGVPMQPKPPDGIPAADDLDAAIAPNRPPRPRSATSMVPEKKVGSQHDLASQLGLNAGARSDVARTSQRLDRTARTIAPGNTRVSDSDSSVSSDEEQPVAPQRPARRRMLPSDPGGGLTGGSQFRMMKVKTATIRRTPDAAHQPPAIGPPRAGTPGGARPRQARARPDDSSAMVPVDESRQGSAGGTGTEISPYSSAPIAPASRGQLQGSKGLATPHELADYTKRKVAEIMARERQALTRDVGGRSSRMSTASDDSQMSIDLDKIRTNRGKSQKGKDESDSSDESDQEEDADQLFMLELKKETLSCQTKLILCMGFMGLILGFLAVFVVLTWTSIERECEQPWFHDTKHFTFSASPRCKWMKRCGNIGGKTCSSEPINCWLEEIDVEHFRGIVDFQLLAPPPSGQTQANLTTQITHYGATRKGISGIASSAKSKDKKLTINSADKNVMSLDTTVDKYINCRKSDITVGLPGDLGTNTAGGGGRPARTLDQFPAIVVQTVYGKVILPNNRNQFYFKSIDLTTKYSDMEYDGLESAELKFTNDEGVTVLKGPKANYITMASQSGAITASAVALQNITQLDPLSGAQIVSWVLDSRLWQCCMPRCDSGLSGNLSG